MRRNLSDKEEKDLLDLYLSGVGYKVLRKKYPCCTVQYLHKLRKRHGIPAHFRSGSYRINKYFFDVIDTEEKAYWLGFFLADGSLKTNDGSVCFALLRSDRVHLEKLKLHTDFEGPIKDYTTQGREYSRLNFCSIYMSGSLRKKGFTCNKSLDARPPLEEIDKPLHRHFWRGVIDGDGHIGFTEFKRSHTLNLVGALGVCTDFSRVVKELTGHRPTITKKANVYGVSVYNRARILVVLNYLYADSTIFLDRKKEKAEYLISWIENNPSREHYQTIKA